MLSTQNPHNYEQRTTSIPDLWAHFLNTSVYTSKAAKVYYEDNGYGSLYDKYGVFEKRHFEEDIASTRAAGLPLTENQQNWLNYQEWEKAWWEEIAMIRQREGVAKGRTVVVNDTNKHAQVK